MKRTTAPWRWAVGGMLLLVGAFSAPLSASAHVGICRSDPVLTLSNGEHLTLYEDISDVATDVTSIQYQVHLPVGLKVLSVQYTGDVPASRQTITVSADETIGNYDAYTVVNTKTANIPVTAYMSGSTVLGILTISCQTAGQSGQSLHSHLHFL